MEVIRLLVKPRNKIARRLYEISGFIVTGEGMNHFGPGEDRMVMSLLLGGRTTLLRNGHANGATVPQVPVD